MAAPEYSTLTGKFFSDINIRRIRKNVQIFPIYYPPKCIYLVEKTASKINISTLKDPIFSFFWIINMANKSFQLKLKLFSSCVVPKKTISYSKFCYYVIVVVSGCFDLKEMNSVLIRFPHHNEPFIIFYSGVLLKTYLLMETENIESCALCNPK